MKILSQLKAKNAGGGVAMNVLRLASNVANGEQIVIGGDTFEIDIINTDNPGTVNLGTAVNATDPFLTIALASHARKVGDLIRMDDEIMRVHQVVDASTIVVTRGACGTTTATHDAGVDIFVSDAAPAVPIIPIGLVTTLTPTAAAPAIVDTINDLNTSGVFADAVSVNEIAIITAEGEVPAAHPCTETLAGSNNAWTAAAMYGAASAGGKGMALVQRAAVAQDVALDHMLFNFPFTVGSVLVQIRTSAGALKTWDGAVTFSGKRVTVTNGGSSDWAATDVVAVFASE